MAMVPSVSVPTVLLVVRLEKPTRSTSSMATHGFQSHRSRHPTMLLFVAHVRVTSRKDCHLVTNVVTRWCRGWLSEHQAHTTEIVDSVWKTLPGGADEHVVLWNLEAPRDVFDETRPKCAFDRDEVDTETRIEPINGLQVFRKLGRYLGLRFVNMDEGIRFVCSFSRT